MKSTFLLTLTAFCLLAISGFAAPPPKAAKEKLPTLTYDVSDLVSTHKGKTGYGKIETVASTIMTALEPNVWNATAENGHNLQVVNGTKLEITTSKENHQQIVELLKALRRLTDVAVDVSCQLYEADRRFLDKERPPPAGKARQESGGRLLPYVLSDAAAGKLGPKAIPGKS